MEHSAVAPPENSRYPQKHLALVLLLMVGILAWDARGYAQKSSPKTVSIPEHRASALAARNAFLENNCADCHNDDERRGGFSTSQLNLAHPELSGELTEKVIQKLRSGMRVQPKPYHAAS